MADNIGTWYRPPGANNQVPNTMTTPLWMVHYAGQVGLYRTVALKVASRERSLVPHERSLAPHPPCNGQLDKKRPSIVTIVLSVIIGLG